ncbi:hypothetical protein TEA_020759 [Camellia sinensis var. sinensis]|uniref:EF-hand domain-containing protein n=1 Tax=Camellia sinensis var. sinensis TaxID=542762 RepID=A0A4S4F1K7_CAMSN|nr:hypothetical protein TEA_020759 [Camellia sinensis var. sinensis]
MLDPHKTCLPSLHKFATKFLQQLKTLRNPKPWKRRKPNILFSRSNFQTSTFTSMEVPNQLKHVFQFLDSNGDGKLSPLELSQVLLSLGHVDKSTAAKEAKKMVLEMDRDGDGLVDIEEFMTVVSIDEEDDDLMDAFAMFDCDKNGLISVEELQRVLRSLGCDSCSIEECREMIKGVDRDGDGFVDFDEFRSMMKVSTLTTTTTTTKPAASDGKIRWENRIAGSDPPEDPILASRFCGFEREMGVEDSGERGGGDDGVVIDIVGEVGTDLGDVGGGNREAIEDGGDEGRSAAKAIGDYDVVFDEDTVAVILDD